MRCHTDCSPKGPEPRANRCGFPAASLRFDPNAQRSRAKHPEGMRRRSYAVWWNEGDGPRRAGKLVLEPLHAVLSGNGGRRLALPFEEIVTIKYTRGELAVDRRRGAPLRIGNLDGAGAMLELADLLKPAA